MDPPELASEPAPCYARRGRIESPMEQDLYYQTHTYIDMQWIYKVKLWISLESIYASPKNEVDQCSLWVDTSMNIDMCVYNTRTWGGGMGTLVYDANLLWALQFHKHCFYYHNGLNFILVGQKLQFTKIQEVMKVQSDNLISPIVFPKYRTYTTYIG